MDVAEVQGARVGHDGRAAVHNPAGAFPVQRDVGAVDSVPTGFEDSRVQHHSGASIVVDGDGPVHERFNFFHVEGSGRVIPDGYELTYSERFTVLLVIRSVGVGLGFPAR